MLEAISKKPRFTPGTFVFNDLTIDYLDGLTFYWEFKNIFENKIYAFKPKSRIPRILDLGGYIGLSTLFFKLAYRNSKITTFEPDKKIFATLKKNIQQNNIQEVKLINAALGKRLGQITFFPDNNDGGSLKESTVLKPIKVTSVKLSKYIHHQIDLIKINIEGSELEVLEECATKLKYVHQLIIEYHNFAEFPKTLDKILNILQNNNFIYRINDYPGDNFETPFKPEKNYKYFNLIYAKKLS